MFSVDQKNLFKAVEEIENKLSMKAFMVGGTVRDLFLGYDPADKDVDFVIAGDALRFAGEVVELVGGDLKRFPEFLTAKILSPQKFPSLSEVDFASSRQEVYERPGKLPRVQSASIEKDLERRDFTINAMAVPAIELRLWGETSYGNVEKLSEITVDFFGGRNDLKNRLVRVLHAESFLDDPTRIFRAFRYVVRIGGSLEDGTKILLKSAIESGCLETVSRSRKLNELKKILLEARSAEVIALLHAEGVMSNLSLYEEERHSEIMAVLHTLDTLVPASAASQKYRSALLLFYLNKDAKERAATYAEYAIGRKQQAELEREAELLLNGEKREGAMASASDAALYLAQVISPAHIAADSRAELERRMGRSVI
ncbi:MAG: CCA tRNA nucleotidyltransferase [Deltaproteobacteria bacterium]|nr:CCA tRNA nucleotidyltransferase [Deltaproteobacteria bacterium]